MSGYWEFPGGKVEPGESDEAALIRELKEELGVEVRVDSHVETTTHEYDFGTIRLAVYRCTLTDGHIQLTEHRAMSWFHPQELPSVTWAPADIPAVEILTREAE